MSFKIADLFPVRKGDLVKLREETNERHRKDYGRWEWDHNGDGAGERFVEGDDHSLYGKMLLVLNDPHKQDMFRGKVVDVFVQEDEKYDIVHVEDLQRMIL